METDNIFSDIDFVNCEFKRRYFGNVSMSNAKWDKKCRFEHSRFHRSTAFDRVILCGKGLETCLGLEFIRVAEDSESRLRMNEGLLECDLPWPERFASWEQLRTFGRLPLFGVSFSALVAIPSVAFGLAVYNEQIDRMREWASR